MEGSICDTQALESPPEFRDGFMSHTWPTLRSQPGQHPGQLQVNPQPCHIPHQRDPSSQSADTASLSRHARPSYLTWEKKQLNTCFSSSKYANIYQLLMQESPPCHLVLSFSSPMTVPDHVPFYIWTFNTLMIKIIINVKTKL